MKSHQVDHKDLIAQTIELLSGNTLEGKRKRLKADVYFHSKHIYFDVWIDESATQSESFTTIEQAVARYNEL